MQLSKLDQFIADLGDNDMDNFIDLMIDDNPFAYQDSYCNQAACDDATIDWISRHDINVWHVTICTLPLDKLLDPS